ncbi:MAG: CcmD family protein [candidate division Zixibacteria bacterium]|nr:CcmD family protein [candidate division Zixibacteria bacterium]
MTSNYTVMAVTLIIWGALFVYLIKLDRKIKKFEDKK